MNYKYCKECRTALIKADSEDGLCLYCRSKKTNCSIKKFGYKQMSIPVPWCHHFNKRIIIGKFKWLCHDCEFWIEENE